MPDSRAAATLTRSLTGVTVAAFLLALAGCGTARVQQGTQYAAALPRPNEIFVRPFAASPEDVKVHMGVLAHIQGNTTPSDRTAKELEVGRKLSWATAEELTRKIRAMGLPVRLSESAPAGMSALVIDGALVSIDEGNETERQVIGLGSGRSQLNLAVTVFEYMPEGHRLVDSFQVDVTGGWKPGALEMGAVGLAMHANPAVMILSNVALGAASEKMSAGIDATAKHGAERTAAVLQRFFQQHGWIP